MTRSIKYFLSYTLFLYTITCFAQQNKVDSLRSFLKKLDVNPSNEFPQTIQGQRDWQWLDTTRINTLNNLAWELMYNNPDTAIILSTEALNLSITPFQKKEISASLKKIQEKCIAQSYHHLAVCFDLKGNYALSLDYNFKALKIWESLNDQKGICSTLCNIGIIYDTQGDRLKTLDYYFKALKIAEDTENKSSTANILGNIGSVYGVIGKYSKALDYIHRALKIYEESNDENKIEITFDNIGIIYGEQADAAKSQGKIMLTDSLYEEALPYFFKALKMAQKLGDKNGIASNLGNFGNVYLNLKKYNKAEAFFKNALLLSDSIGELEYTMGFENAISELYIQTNQPAKALEHYKKFIAAKDSLFNEENTKKSVRSEMNFEFEKNQAIEKSEREKQNAISQEEKQKQKIILILVSCFLMLVAVFAGFMFNRWRITQKQKLIIEKQKEKIVDSITYAQLIQQSILMEESEIQKLLPNSFIYFQPKDIVSGDFYWCSKTNDKIILAAVDCTGHGVPGAFMSMIGNTLLNQIVNEKKITTPSEILKHLNLEVTEALHQKKEGALSHDGMDIAICCIDYTTNQIQYAGAQNPLFILTDNEINVIKADIQSIGGDVSKYRKKISPAAEFTNHTITIKKDMSIFLFSDGYMDQFGGNERKKFGIQKFKELLLNNQHLSTQQQKEAIANAHQDWKGSTTQIDDILVIGLRL
jgi:serine phosphatase RsbU (regulator of sigma subunit)